MMLSPIAAPRTRCGFWSRGWSATGLALVVLVQSGAAQAPGLPVLNQGAPRGFTLVTLAGFGNDAAGSGTALALFGTVGFRRVAVGGFVSGLGHSTVDDGTILAGGGHLTVKLAGGPLVPIAINLQMGAGYHAVGADPASRRTTWRAPIGLGIAWTIPQPVVALKPWIAPRLDVQRTSFPDPLADPVAGGSVPRTSSTDVEFGLSGGLNLGFLNGFAIDLAVDRVFQGTESQPTTVGVGVSFTFK
jgi:hypothetical protein